jgi:predicted NBD/HSP70 family sugar kinase
MATGLFTPVLNDRTRAPYFFNGRLLTGEAMTDEQRAQEMAHEILARGLGDGVAYGLQVAIATAVSTLDNPVMTVKAGVAVNRKGELLFLKEDADVQLKRPAHASQAPKVLFTSCQPPQQGTYVADAGVYLLTVSSITAGDGLAPVSGLGGPQSCNVKYRVDAVQFRLIELPVAAGVLADTVRLRNRVAYDCFGVSGLDDFAEDAFGARAEPATLLDAVRTTTLTDCDVPLAVLYWTATGGIQFVDMWAVRRRLTHTRPATTFPAFSDARLAATEAMLLQLDEHLAAMASAGLLHSAVSGKTTFRYLPPAGLIPLQMTGKPGINVTQFFAGKTTRGPVHFGGAALPALLRASAEYPPVDLDAEEMIWLYYCAENMKAANAPGAGTARPQAYVVFSNGHIPYVANARFDLALWDYSNYALVVPAI